MQAPVPMVLPPSQRSETAAVYDHEPNPAGPVRAPLHFPLRLEAQLREEGIPVPFSAIIAEAVLANKTLTSNIDALHRSEMRVHSI